MKLKLKKKKNFFTKMFYRKKATLAKVILLLGLALLIFYMAFYGIYKLGFAKNVEKLTISSEKIGLKVGAKYQLSVSVYPSNAVNKGVKWKSSDEKIAKVNKQGVVTAIKSGTAIITVSSSNNKKIVDSIDIVVNTKDVKLSKIILSHGDIFLQQGYTYLIVTNFEPYGSNNLKLKYESSNEDIATIDHLGFVRGNTIGRTTITVTDEKTGIAGTCKIFVLSSGGEFGNS